MSKGRATSHRAVTTQARVERKAHLLVADVDRATAETLAAVLRHEGYAVDVASSLANAQKLAVAQRYDVVLVDFGKGGNGELAELTVPHATVVVLTGYASLESALQAMRAGAYGYIVKPVDLDELRLTVARALERRALERELAARVGELEAAHAEVQNFNKRLRARVDAATEELRDKVAQLDDANRQLREAQEQHDRFVAMVAHEMRGPLNPIINYAQLAKRTNLPDGTVQRYMDLIIEQAFRLNRLVDDLQTATRLTTGQFSLRRESFDLAASARDLVDQFKASVQERRFTFSCHPESVIIEADPDRVLQAVRNLVDNAVKYSVENGAIEVTIVGDEQNVTISVGDYGAGIAEADMKRIFDAFTRLGTRQGEISGTGLGLFITRGIVAAHGGTLTVANRAGDERVNGAVFTITLPLKPADAAK